MSEIEVLERKLFLKSQYVHILELHINELEKELEGLDREPFSAGDANAS